MAQRKRNPRKAQPRRTLRARVAETEPRPRGGRTSVIDTIPGLRDDLANTIRDELKKPLRDRLNIAQLFVLCQEAYPELDEAGFKYNSFWKYVVRTFDYHASTRQAPKE
jgi:hypothetical protein